MIVYGRNTVIEAIKSLYPVDTLFVEENIKHDEKIANILRLAKQSNIDIQFFPNKSLSKITRSEEHQGIACDIEYKESKFNEIDWENDMGFIYISEATFEQNIGAIIRTAECAGFGGVIIPNKVEITPTIAKISTGALFHIPVISYPIYQAIKDFKKEGYAIYGIERDGKSYFEEEISSRALFIIGGEDKSLSDGVREECDAILEIPQFGKINSLNMSNASSIVIYEYVRQNSKRS